MFAMWSRHRFAALFVCAMVCSAAGDYDNERRLRSDLFGDYDAGCRPETKHNGTVHVRVSMNPLDAPILYGYKHLFHVDASMCMDWTDPRLTWDVDEYDGLGSLRVSADDIWTPPLEMHTWADALSTAPMATTAFLLPNGTVMFCTKQSASSSCQMDMTYFPFDRHECVVEYATIKDVEKQLNLSIFRPARIHPTQGSEFRLVSVTSNRWIEDYGGDDRYTFILYRFTLERRSRLYHYAVLVPAILAALLTLAVFWPPPASKRKLVLGGIGLLVSQLVLHRATDAVAGSERTPKIVALLGVTVQANVAAIVCAAATMNLSRRPQGRPLPSFLVKISRLIATGFSACGSSPLRSTTLVLQKAPGMQEQSSGEVGFTDGYIVARALDRALLLVFTVTLALVLFV
nr:histamine-gated chloride channel, his-4 [Ixodes ricinus]